MRSPVSTSSQASRPPRFMSSPKFNALGLQRRELALDLGGRNRRVLGDRTAGSIAQFGPLREGLGFRGPVALGRISDRKPQNSPERFAVPDGIFSRNAEGSIGAHGSRVAHLIRAFRRSQHLQSGGLSNGGRRNFRVTCESSISREPKARPTGAVTLKSTSFRFGQGPDRVAHTRQGVLEFVAGIQEAELEGAVRFGLSGSRGS